VLCRKSDGVTASLSVGTVYPVIRPEPRDPAYALRVLDESGEDYLYDARWFTSVAIPPSLGKAIIARLTGTVATGRASGSRDGR